MKAITRIVCALLGLAMLAVAPARAAEGDVTFAGKRINLLIGFSSSGFGYDTYGRALARHLGKHLPGNPTIVPQNRPGAGSLSLMNQLYNAAAKDGTDIGLVGRGAAMEPLLAGANSTARFEAVKFNWLGSMNNEVAAFFLSSKAPAKDLKEVLAGKEIQVGSTGAGGDLDIFARTLNGTLNTKLKIVSGYPGTNEVLLSIARNELDGMVGYSWGVARLGSRDDIEKGNLKVIMQLALTKHPELANVPLVTDLVSNDESKKLLELVFSRQSMGRPLVAPPGVDPRVVAVLRKGFDDTLKDPAFLAECEKLGLEINFVSGADVQDLVTKAYALPPSIIERARKILN